MRPSVILGPAERVEVWADFSGMGKGDEAIHQTSEQSPLEHYRIGQPVKAFVLEVRRSASGIVSFTLASTSSIEILSSASVLNTVSRRSSS